MNSTEGSLQVIFVIEILEEQTESDPLAGVIQSSQCEHVQFVKIALMYFPSVPSTLLCQYMLADGAPPPAL